MNRLVLVIKTSCSVLADCLVINQIWNTCLVNHSFQVDRLNELLLFVFFVVFLNLLHNIKSLLCTEVAFLTGVQCRQKFLFGCT